MIATAQLKSLFLSELGQDRAADDVTTRLLGEKVREKCRVRIISKAPGVFCGEKVVSAIRELFAAEVEGLEFLRDGTLFSMGDTVLSFSTTILRALTLERTLLNVLSHLCGIATTTRKYVEAVRPYPAKILATRKTLPGLRDLQLLGVMAGGGFVHRRSLSDGILIKDNHVSIAGICSLLESARRDHSPLHKTEIEVQNLEQLDELLQRGGADVVMLDNFDLATLSEGIQRIRKAAPQLKIEISGGVQLDRVKEIAALGVDYISVGALTHSVTALNLSQEIQL